MMRVLQAGWNPVGDWPTMNAVGSGRMSDVASNATYVGGMPVGLLADGFTVGGIAGTVEVLAGVGAAGNASNMLGLMFNNVLIDQQRGRGEKNVVFTINDALPTIVLTPCYVEMWRGTSASTALPMSHDVVDNRSPFITTELTAINDLIFISDTAGVDNSGLLTETAGGVNTVPIGRVIKGAADDTETLIALFWSTPEQVMTG